MNELYWKPAHELAAMIRRREIKPSELMELTIKRIEQTNPKLNAFCALRADGAMAEARALDEKIARREEVGALAGLPLGVKDLEDTAGLRTTFGSKPFKDNMPKSDSIQVARLKAAGAIVIGKTNAPEFGYTGFHQEPAVRCHPQSMESRAHARRIVGRQLGRHRRRRGADRDRLRRRRLGANPGLLHRMLRAETDTTAGFRTTRRSGCNNGTTPPCMERSRAPCATPRCSWTRSSAITRPIPTRVPHPGISYHAILERIAQKTSHRISSRLRPARAARRGARNRKSCRRVQEPRPRRDDHR